MDELLSDFVGETLEMMEAVSGELVAWESNPVHREPLDSIFRLVHTVKGSSGFFSLPRITAVSHAAEELLGALRSQTIEPKPEIVSVVLGAFELIRTLTQGLGETGTEPTGDDSQIIETINAALRGENIVKSTPMDAADASSAIICGDGSEPATDNDPSTPTGMAASVRTVRVPLPLLDALMNGVSDLVLARNEVAAKLRQLDVDQAMQGTFDRLSNLLGSVRASVSQMRMVPLRNLFSTMPRIVRQLADELGKPVRVVVEGGEVEIDREVMEALRDPMTHIMRNAIDHGIENTDDRVATGKSVTGTLRISANQSGNHIVIRIDDDGRGLDLDKIVGKAVAARRVSEADARAMSDAQKAELVFLPGLSTADKVTGISGRGVGMDVVKANIERLGGSVAVESRPGQGMTLTIDVPMTLSIVSAVALSANGQGLAIPRSAVQEVLLATNEAIKCESIAGSTVLRVRGRLLPVIQLEATLGMPKDTSVEDRHRSFLICRLSSGRPVVLDAPDVRDHEELVIKPLPPALLDIGLYSGLSLPDDGTPMLILDIEGMARAQAVPDIDVLETEHEEEVGTVQTEEQWLRYSAWGSKRGSAIAMSTIKRIADIQAESFQTIEGHVFACVDGYIIPVLETAFTCPDEGKVRTICIGDDRRCILVPVHEIIGLTDITVEMKTDARTSHLLGICYRDGELVEMYDSHALLASLGREVRKSRTEPSAGERQLWIIDPHDSGWARSFLKPALAVAGYRVELVTDEALVPEGHPRLVIGRGNEAGQLFDAGGSVATIDLYDRASMFAAVEAVCKAGVAA